MICRLAATCTEGGSDRVAGTDLSCPVSGARREVPTTLERPGAGGAAIMSLRPPIAAGGEPITGGGAITGGAMARLFTPSPSFGRSVGAGGDTWGKGFDGIRRDALLDWNTEGFGLATGGLASTSITRRSNDGARTGPNDSALLREGVLIGRGGAGRAAALNGRIGGGP